MRGANLSAAQRRALKERSGGQCEALIAAGRTYARCWKMPVEHHHRMTKARGGRLLDAVDEIYHLIDLCHLHHTLADGDEAYEGNLLIPGYVGWDKIHDRPVYSGPDPYLSERYPHA